MLNRSGDVVSNSPGMRISSNVRRVGQALDVLAQHGGSIGAGALSMLIGNKRIGAPASGSGRKPSKKSKAANAAAVKKSYNDALTTALVKPNSRKGSKSKKPAFTKREKDSIKRLAKNQDKYQRVLSTRDYIFGDIHCNFNKVAWFSVDNRTAQIMLNATDWTIRNPASVGAPIATGVPATGAYLEGQDVRFERKENYTFCNNSNSQGEVVIYEMVATDFNSITPFVDMQSLRDAHYSQTTTSLAAVDDFNQYMSVPGQKSDHWKIKKKTTFNVKGGEQFKYFFDTGKQTLKTSRWREEGLPSYFPGYVFLEIRIVGRITHSAKESTPALIGSHPGLYQNQMTEFFPLDYLADSKRIYHVKTASDVLASFAVPVVSNLYTPSAVDEEAVNADPEAAGIGPPDQT